MDIESWLTVLTFLSGGAGLLLKSNPKAVKAIGLACSGSVFLALLATLSGSRDNEIPILLLISGSAFVSILSQQLVRQAATAITIVLFIAGLSFGYLNSALPEPIPIISLGCLLGTLAISLFRCRRDNLLALGAAVGYFLAIVFLVLSFVVAGPWSLVCRLATAAVLLPLFPLHVSYVGSLTSLGGACPAFLAIALPLLGWHTIVANSPEIPHPIAEIVACIAVIGALLTAIRTSVQIDLTRTFASIGTILMAPVWLTIGTGAKVDSETCCYLISVSVATSGLLLCAHHLESRYGTRILENLRGLAQPMPKFSILLGLLIMVAAGFPAFAVFSMLMAMVLANNQLHVIILAPAIGLASSLLLVTVLQKLLFGKPRSDLVYEDLGLCDSGALILIAAFLAGGVLFPQIFPPSLSESAHKVGVCQNKI